jgi:hypothetical protein
MLAICFMLVSCLASTVKITAKFSSETSDDFRRAIKRYIPGNVALRNHRVENLES